MRVAILWLVVHHEQPVWLYADDGFPEAGDYDDGFVPLVSPAPVGADEARASLVERIAASAGRALASLRRVLRVA